MVPMNVAKLYIVGHKYWSYKQILLIYYKNIGYMLYIMFMHRYIHFMLRDLYR